MNLSPRWLLLITVSPHLLFSESPLLLLLTWTTLTRTTNLSKIYNIEVQIIVMNLCWVCLTTTYHIPLTLTMPFCKWPPPHTHSHLCLLILYLKLPLRLTPYPSHSVHALRTDSQPLSSERVKQHTVHKLEERIEWIRLQDFYEEEYMSTKNQPNIIFGSRVNWINHPSVADTIVQWFMWMVSIDLGIFDNGLVFEKNYLRAETFLAMNRSSRSCY